MKRLTVLILLVILIITPVNDAFTAIPGFAPPKRPIKIYINGNEVRLDLPILNKANRNYYPFREMCEVAGAVVTWDSENDRAIAELDGNRIEFEIGKNSYYLNGIHKTMPDATTIVDKSVNRSYVPIRYAMEGLGFDVALFITQRYDIIRIAKPKPTEEEDVILQLQGYRDNIGAPKYFPEDYKPNAEFLKIGWTPAYTINEATVQEIVRNACNLLLTDFYVNYNNMTGFYEKYRYFFMPEASHSFWINGKEYSNEEYIQLRIGDIKKYKIICKSEVISDSSLVYDSWEGNTKVRCRLKICYNSVDPQYFKKYNLPFLSLNKWYYVDMEVGIAIFLSRNPNKWEHPLFTFDNYTYISSFKELK